MKKEIFNYLLGFDNKYFGFLKEHTPAQEDEIYSMFEETAKVFNDMGEEKLIMANEFVRDLRLYNQNDALTVDYFSDIEKRYLLLSDLYDFLRLKRLLNER